jgi:hypothetical protein
MIPYRTFSGALKNWKGCQQHRAAFGHQNSGNAACRRMGQQRVLGRKVRGERPNRNFIARLQVDGHALDAMPIGVIDGDQLHLEVMHHVIRECLSIVVFVWRYDIFISGIPSAEVARDPS